MKKYRKVIPAGFLRTGGKEYLLLAPYPIVGDSWEDDNTYRFLATPNDFILQDDAIVYPPARHIVTNSFSIEYSLFETPIYVETFDEYDVGNIEKFETEEFIHD